MLKYSALEDIFRRLHLMSTSQQRKTLGSTYICKSLYLSQTKLFGSFVCQQFLHKFGVLPRQDSCQPKE